MKRLKLKSLFLPAAILVLLGLSMCLVVEPAIALTHDETDCSETSEHCCFICNQTQHQWDTFRHFVANPPEPIGVDLSVAKLDSYNHSYPVSIFHPPPLTLRI